MAILNQSSSAASTPGSENTNYRGPLTVITSLFFIFGFITCLNDTLIPHLKGLFNLNYTQASMVQFCFFAAYFLVSLPAGKLLGKIGYKNGMITGLVIAGLGCLMFYPAAAQHSYALFLSGLFVLASGITTIQVAANPYVAVLGPIKTSSSRLNLVQAFNSLGTTLAPLFGSMLILSTIGNGGPELMIYDPNREETIRLAKAQAVQGPYLGLAAALFVLAVFVAFSKLPKISPNQDSSAEKNETSKKSIWEFRHLVLGAIGIFVYVGAEVSIGSFLVNLLAEPSIAGLAADKAGQYVAFYWGGAMVGRFIGSGILQRFDSAKVLGIYSIFAMALVILTLTTSGSTAMYAILSVGFFNSIMFPNIFTLSIQGLGKFTAQGSGILCAAIVGGAIVPVIQGYLADRIGIHSSFLLPIICYAYIAHYGFKGSVEYKN